MERLQQFPDGFKRLARDISHGQSRRQAAIYNSDEVRTRAARNPPTRLTAQGFRAPCFSETREGAAQMNLWHTRHLFHVSTGSASQPPVPSPLAHIHPIFLILWRIRPNRIDDKKVVRSCCPVLFVRSHGPVFVVRSCESWTSRVSWGVLGSWGAWNPNTLAHLAWSLSAGKSLFSKLIGSRRDWQVTSLYLHRVVVADVCVHVAARNTHRIDMKHGADWPLKPHSGAKRPAFPSWSQLLVHGPQIAPPVQTIVKRVKTRKKCLVQSGRQISCAGHANMLALPVCVCLIVMPTGECYGSLLRLGR